MSYRDRLSPRRQRQPARGQQWDWDQDDPAAELDPASPGLGEYVSPAGDLPEWPNSDSDSVPIDQVGARAPDRRAADRRQRIEPPPYPQSASRTPNLPELSRALLSPRIAEQQPGSPGARSGLPSYPIAEPDRQRTAAHGADPGWLADDDPAWTDDSQYEPADGYMTSPGPAGRPRVNRSRARPRRQTSPWQPPSLQLPGFLVQAAAARDQILLTMAGISLVSLAVMAALVGARIDQVPQVVALHLDAAGFPDRWGNRTALWRLPLATSMLTVMTFLVAWLLASRDRFASRFTLASLLLVHILSWIAVLQLLW